MIGVSVIVPVYNVEEYLEECLESIVNQTFEDIEIICVNDGSTDSSLDILERYENADERIRIITQENKGLGGARNTGLECANGKYIYFCDSDDYLELTALEELFSIAEGKDLDLVLFKLRNFEDGTNEFSYEEYHEMDDLKGIVGDNVFDYRDISEVLFDMDVTVYTKLFKRDLISDLRFTEDLIFEDNLYHSEYIFKAKRICFYDKHLYNRRVRNNSIISSHSKSYADVIEIFNAIAFNVKECGLYDTFKEALFTKKVKTTIYRFGIINDEYKEYFFDLIKKDFADKQEEYERELDFSIIDERAKSLFYEALYSNDYKEFELKIKIVYYGNEIYVLLNNFHRLKIFQTARIDMKNFGGKDNEIEILSNSDSRSQEAHPDWFKDDEGEGLTITSFNDFLDLEIKAVEDGELKIYLKSQDIKDRNNERFPVFIDYRSVVINDVNYLKEPALVYHDHPTVIKKKVSDCEVLKIHFEWTSFASRQSLYNDKLKVNELKSKNNELEQKVKDLKNRNNELEENVWELKKNNEELKRELDEMQSSKFWKFGKRLK